ncbi:hypothetical protein LZ32DRAFT_22319 [Colletotrichum eremochloae]|nr:hypothetical protein LZ32DRAFT_22319 [Colletotrichum eremochloae]
MVEAYCLSVLVIIGTAMLGTWLRLIVLDKSNSANGAPLPTIRDKTLMASVCALPPNYFVLLKGR